MKLENQVISLKLAKRLKELRVKQESLFYWFKQFKEDDYLLNYIDNYHHEIDLNIFSKNVVEIYSAFTVAELGEMLPDIIHGSPLQITKRIDKEELITNYCSSYHLSYLIVKPSIKMSDSLANILIYLIENKIIEVNP